MLKNKKSTAAVAPTAQYTLHTYTAHCVHCTRYTLKLHSQLPSNVKCQISPLSHQLFSSDDVKQSKYQQVKIIWVLPALCP